MSAPPSQKSRGVRQSSRRAPRLFVRRQITGSAAEVKALRPGMHCGIERARGDMDIAPRQGSNALILQQYRPPHNRENIGDKEYESCSYSRDVALRKSIFQLSDTSFFESLCVMRPRGNIFQSRRIRKSSAIFRKCSCSKRSKCSVLFRRSLFSWVLLYLIVTNNPTIEYTLE